MAELSSRRTKVNGEATRGNKAMNVARVLDADKGIVAGMKDGRCGRQTHNRFKAVVRRSNCAVRRGRAVRMGSVVRTRRVRCG